MRGKKAVFFTILSLLFIDVMILSYQASIDYTESRSFEPIRSRINSIEHFIDSLEGDSQKALYIGGYRAMITLNNYVTSFGVPVSHVGGGLDQVYEELLINGTIEGDTSESLLMSSQTLLDWQSRVEGFADELDLDVEMTFWDLSIEHESSFHLKTSIRINYTLNDTRGTCSFNRTVYVETIIPIEFWIDPLYALRTEGVIRQIRPTNMTSLDSTNINLYIGDGLYINSTSAPSFLVRLDNRTEPSPYGIESILDLNLPEIDDSSNEHNRSVVDHVYWNISRAPSAQIQDITSSYGWFRLDQDSMLRYGLTNTTQFN